MHPYHAFYQGNELLLLPVLALLIFLTIFVLAAIRAWKANQPARVAELSAMPLLDDTSRIPPSGDGHE